MRSNHAPTASKLVLTVFRALHQSPEAVGDELSRLMWLRAFRDMSNFYFVMALISMSLTILVYQGCRG
jgi:hypothetical protein